jgi:GNAT superfamily N-acetyltransferase
MIPIDRLILRVVNTRPEHIPALAAMQRVIFPTLTEEEYFTEAKYRNHLRLFPEGQFVALAYYEGAEVIVGATSTFRIDFDFDHIQHTFLEAVDHGWLSNHDPQGDWLYGADLSVHPDWRGRHIGRRLYEARQELVRQLNLRGELAGAMLPGYHYHRKQLTVPQYVLRVTQGRLKDPTLSMQLKNGFEVRGILYNHLTDPRSRNAASLIVRDNPDYRVPRRRAQPARIPREPAPIGRGV